MAVVSPDVSAQQGEAGRQYANDQARWQALYESEVARLQKEQADSQAEWQRQWQAAVDEALKQRETNAEWANAQLQKLDEAAWDHRTAVIAGANDIAAKAENAANIQLTTERDAIRAQEQAAREALLAEENERTRIANEQFNAAHGEAARQRQLETAWLEESKRAIEDNMRRQAEADRAAKAAAEKRAADARTYVTGRQDLIKGYQSTVDQAFGQFDDQYFNDFAKTFIDTYKPDLQREFERQRKQTLYGFANAGNINSTAAAEAFADLDRNRQKAEGVLAGKAADAAGRYRQDIAGQKSSALQTLFSSGAVGEDNLPDGADVTSLLGDLSTRTGALGDSAGTLAQALRATDGYMGYTASIDGVTLPNKRKSSELSSLFAGGRSTYAPASSGYVVG